MMSGLEMDLPDHQWIYKTMENICFAIFCLVPFFVLQQAGRMHLHTGRQNLQCDPPNFQAISVRLSRAAMSELPAQRSGHTKLIRHNQHLQQQEDLSSLVATRIGKAALLKSLGQSRSSSRSSHGPKGSGQTSDAVAAPSDAVAAPSSPTVVQDSIEVLGGLTPEEREVLEGSQVRRD